MHQQILVSVFLASDSSCDVPVLRPVSSAAGQCFSFICVVQREQNDAVSSYGRTSPYAEKTAAPLREHTFRKDQRGRGRSLVVASSYITKTTIPRLRLRHVHCPSIYQVYTRQNISAQLQPLQQTCQTTGGR